MGKDISIADQPRAPGAALCQAALGTIRRMNPIAHEDIITDGDYNKIEYLFDHKKDARSLTQQVWFYVNLHFRSRGRELQCLLRKTDLQFHTDEHGAEYVKLGNNLPKCITSW